MKELYLMRHLATQYANGHAFCGWMDCPILENQQINVDADVFAGVEREMLVYVSPLKRCMQTLEQLHQRYGFSNVVISDDLKERNYGIYNGVSKCEIDLVSGFRVLDSVSPPNGESVLDVRTRVERVLSQIKKADGEKVLVVSHQGVLREIYYGMGRREFQKFQCGEMRREQW